MTPTFAQGMFQIDPNATPEQIARKRAAIAALMPQYGKARYVGEGLGQLAYGIGAGIQSRKIDKAEGAGRQGADDLFQRILSGASGSPDQGGFTMMGAQPAPQPVSPGKAVANDTMAALGKPPVDGGYRASLIGTESGGRWDAKNNEMGAGGKAGHFGRVQFGQARLQEAMNAGAIPQGMTPEQFMASPEAQIAAENWHFADLERQLAPLVGSTVNGQVMDMGALVAVGHLGGAAGARKYVESGGRYNPSDAFGTSLSDYAQKHGGKGGGMSSPEQTTQVSGGGEIPLENLYSALANPWLDETQRGVITSMIEQRTQAADPMRALQLRKAQLEVEGMQQPEAPKGVVVGGRIVDPSSGQVIYQPGPGEAGATEYGLQPQYGVDDQGNPVLIQIGKDGTATQTRLPEGVTFQKEPIRIDGGTEWILLDPITRQPVGSVPKQLREAAAETATGRIEGENAANAAAALSGNMAQVDEAVALIDSVMNDPALPSITGMIQGRLPPLSQAGTDLNVKIKQLQGKAFLEAFESLKGGGAITEREGQAATEAMARLDRAQSYEAYRAALAELKAIMQKGAERARAGAGQTATQPAAPTDADTELFRKYGIAP
jgi:hypothetical protein